MEFVNFRDDVYYDFVWSPTRRTRSNVPKIFHAGVHFEMLVDEIFRFDTNLKIQIQKYNIFFDSALKVPVSDFYKFSYT